MKWPPGLERKHQQQSVVLVQEVGKVVSGGKYDQVRDPSPLKVTGNLWGRLSFGGTLGIL